MSNDNHTTAKEMREQAKKVNDKELKEKLRKKANQLEKGKTIDK